MIERGGGSIMNVASMLGLVGTKYSSSYATAKAGLIELTKITAVDYGEHSIRANCICPGGMQPADLIDMSPEDLAKIMESVHAAGGFPISRFAHMTEVAEFILTVVGPVGLSMTGSVIAFDGGYTAK
jgi:NAD(P)-dependent dehydrogenase (short-subunit alcohol dehydrogenase family)